MSQLPLFEGLPESDLVEGVITSAQIAEFERELFLQGSARECLCMGIHALNSDHWSARIVIPERPAQPISLELMRYHIIMVAKVARHFGFYGIWMKRLPAVVLGDVRYVEE